MILELIDAMRSRVGGGAPAMPPQRSSASQSGARAGTAIVFIAIVATAVALGVSAVLLFSALRMLDVARSTLATANAAAAEAHRHDVERLEGLEHTGRALEQDLALLQRLNATSARQNTTARAGFTAAVHAADQLQAQLREDLTLTKSEIAALDTHRSAATGGRALQARPQLVFTVFSKFNGTLSDPARANRATFPARVDGSPLTVAIGIRNAGTGPLLHAVVTAAAAYPASASVQAFFRANDPAHAQTTELTTSRSPAESYVLLVSVTPNGQKSLRLTVNASGTAVDGTPYAATPSFTAIIAEPPHW